jgi:hypothetical protein
MVHLESRERSCNRAWRDFITTSQRARLLCERVPFPVLPMSTNPSYSWWRETFSTVQPLGYALREAFPDRWLRIHGLPAMQRYANTEEERALLRERHRHATALLFAEGADCRLIVPCSYKDDPCFSGLGLAPASELPAYQPEQDEPPYGPFHAAVLRWDFDTFRPVLDAVANDAVRALVVCPGTTHVYAPYDGGADLFFPNPAARDQARQELRAYLSPRADGL